jgi:predicted nucleotidyltransferase
MSPPITLAERKATEAARRAAAVDSLIPVLTARAKALGGRYLLFGSAARGTMKFGSDVDILLDFPGPAFPEAWGFAEQACWDRDLEPDLLPYGGCRPEFLAHIEPDIKVLG